MGRKHGPMKPDEAVRLLRADGWVIKRQGPSDHVQFAHPTEIGNVTLDMGADPIPTGTRRSILRQAG